MEQAQQETGQEQEADTERDYYAAHLAEVNEDNEVLSTEDIVNSRGVLLCRKGTRIDRRMADRIVQHKLVKPLEDQVQIRDSIDGQQLYEQCRGLLDKYADLQQLHAAHKFSAECKDLFTERRLHPNLIQKLTVMRDRMPEELEKGLFCAWLAALMTREMDLGFESMRSAFMAGLLHDMGFLHISPDILRKREQLTAAEWRAIQSHVVVGEKVLQNTPGVSSDVARAVLEHHERCDGSGYPVGKSDEQLSVMSQVVGMADSIQSIRIHQFEERGRNLRDVLPYLQMNAHTHFYDVYKAMCALLRTSELQPTPIDPGTDVCALAHRLAERGRALKQAVRTLTQPRVIDLADGASTNSRGISIAKVTNHVLVMSAQSGLVSDELFGWLADLERQPHTEALGELNEIELMQNELQWQLNSARKAFKGFFETEPGTSEHTELEKISAQLDEQLARL